MNKRKPKASRKDPNVYPPGYDYARIKAIADYYDSGKDEDVLADAEITQSAANLVWMEVPQELVPKVRKLMAGRKKSA